MFFKFILLTIGRLNAIKHGNIHHCVDSSAEPAYSMSLSDRVIDIKHIVTHTVYPHCSRYYSIMLNVCRALGRPPVSLIPPRLSFNFQISPPSELVYRGIYMQYIEVVRPTKHITYHLAGVISRISPEHTPPVDTKIPHFSSEVRELHVRTLNLPNLNHQV